MIYDRKIINNLRKQITYKEITVLTGMRRVGKTTTLKIIFDEIESGNKVFLDIENPLEQRIFEEMDFNNIWANLKSYGITEKEKAFLFLDEIQAMPEIVKAIKYLYDHYNVKFFLTGSSSFYLKNLFPESLSGRKISFELYPLDFEEFLIFKEHNKKFHKDFPEKDNNKNFIQYEKLKKLYDEYLEYGGFPQVVLTEDISQKILQLKDIFKSYFEKDVASLADIRHINLFRDMLLLLLSRAGSKLDISKIASEIGISRKTVYSYLSFLKDTYFIELISPFSRSVDREISSTKKLYICDNGFLSQFARVSEGVLFENSVFLNLRKYGSINYYEKRSGGEIDFIVQDIKTAIEVKRSGSESDFQKLSRLSKDLRLPDKYIITYNYRDGHGFIPAMEL